MMLGRLVLAALDAHYLRRAGKERAQACQAGADDGSADLNVREDGGLFERGWKTGRGLLEGRGLTVEADAGRYGGLTGCILWIGM